jgi:hypothetical protein
MWAQAGLRAAGLAGAVLRVGTAAGADRASGTSVPQGLDPDTAAGKLASWQAGKRSSGRLNSGPCRRRSPLCLWFRRAIEPRAHDRNDRAVALHALLTGGDHGVAGFQPIQNFHLAEAAQPDLYLHALGRSGLLAGPLSSLMTNFLPPCGTITSSGITRALSRAPKTVLTRANMPGRDCSWRLSMQARTPTERPLISISGSIACKCATYC